jgi:hypothetical protein
MAGDDVEHAAHQPGVRVHRDRGQVQVVPAHLFRSAVVVAPSANKPLRLQFAEVGPVRTGGPTYSVVARPPGGAVVFALTSAVVSMTVASPSKVSSGLR